MNTTTSNSHTFIMYTISRLTYIWKSRAVPFEVRKNNHIFGEDGGVGGDKKK